MSTHRSGHTYPYAMHKWGEGYFSVNEAGKLCVQADEHAPAVMVDQIIDHCREAGLDLPLLIRFDEILHDRVHQLNQAFESAKGKRDYAGQYQAVYPIKVNQQRGVIEQLTDVQDGAIGLEAGSKPELLAVLALTSNRSRIIVCNGYKDASYVEAALLGQQLGFSVYLVVEKLSELSLILSLSEKLGVQPQIGLRVRLRSIGKGNWQNTGGVKSKFGLDAQQLQQAIETLNESDAIASLKMIHVHLGSQIANLRDIKSGLQEVARFYAELKKSAPSLDTIDVGGGLGVDYDGTGSRGYYSMNYSIDDYAEAIVDCFDNMAKTGGFEAPHIVSESGRALTAHHAILVANIIDYETQQNGANNQDESESGHALLKTLREEFEALQAGLSDRALVEVFHETEQCINDVQEAFIAGDCSLQDKSEANAWHRAIQQQLLAVLDPAHREHRKILLELESQLAVKLFVNFSVFQSVPDVWGIDQVFPITPTRHLNDKDRCHAVIQDITCDSDGRIDSYVTDTGIEATLRIPQAAIDEHAPLCFFMVGAYQEILGDMHNLFGDTNAVSVSIQASASGAFRISSIERGDTVAQVLDYVHLDPQFIEEQLKQSVLESGLDASTQADIQSRLLNSLQHSTYLSDTSN